VPARRTAACGGLRIVWSYAPTLAFQFGAETAPVTVATQARSPRKTESKPVNIVAGNAGCSLRGLAVVTNSPRVFSTREAGGRSGPHRHLPAPSDFRGRCGNSREMRAVAIAKLCLYTAGAF